MRVMHAPYPHTMRTTITLSDELLENAKIEAGKRRQTLSDYISDAVAARIAGAAQTSRTAPPAVPVFTRGRLRPGVDATTNRGLLEAMEDGRH